MGKVHDRSASIGWPSDNDVGPYQCWWDQSTSRADRRHGRGTANLRPTGASRQDGSSPHRAADGGSGTAVGEEMSVKSALRHAGPPPHCGRCVTGCVSLSRQAGAGDTRCLHCEAWKLELCESYKTAEAQPSTGLSARLFAAYVTSGGNEVIDYALQHNQLCGRHMCTPSCVTCSLRFL